MSNRHPPKVRRRQILQAAITEAERVGYRLFTRSDVAERAQCAPGLIGYYFEDMGALRAAVMRAAVRQPYLAILAQGLAARDSHALEAPPALKRQAAALLARA